MVKKIRGKFIFLHRKSLLISNSLRLMQKPFCVGKDTGACIHMEPSPGRMLQRLPSALVSGEEPAGLSGGKQGPWADGGGGGREGGCLPCAFFRRFGLFASCMYYLFLKMFKFREHIKEKKKRETWLHGSDRRIFLRNFLRTKA